MRLFLTITIMVLIPVCVALIPYCIGVFFDLVCNVIRYGLWETDDHTKLVYWVVGFFVLCVATIACTALTGISFTVYNLLGGIQ